MCGARSGSYGRSTRLGTKCSSEDEMTLMKGARASLWKILRGVSLKGGIVQSINSYKLSLQCSVQCQEKSAENLEINHPILGDTVHAV